MTAHRGRRTLPYLALAGVAVLVSYGLFLYLRKELGPDHRYRVTIFFHDVDGLRTASDVKIGGVPGGQVGTLEVTKGDVARATVLLDANAAPIGRGATARIRPVNLLGEKYVDLSPGDLSHPLPSGATIPATRTGAPVELDDVLNMLQPDVRARLRVLIDEAGVALDGRGADFSSLLQALPPSLDETGRLIGSFAADNARLRDVISAGDRVLASLQSRSGDLNRLVSSAADALAVSASRRQQLGATLGQAPSTLAQLRATLGQLSATAGQLIPASDELRASAAPLAETLGRLPAFADAAAPALRTARAVAPSLTRLGTQATSPVHRLAQTASLLNNFALQLDPLTAGLDQQTPSLLAVIEGWARTIANRDALGHLFRTHITVDKYLLTDALSRYARLLGQNVGAPSARPLAAGRQTGAGSAPAAGGQGGSAQPPAATAPAGSPPPSSPPTLLGLPLPGLLGPPAGSSQGADPSPAQGSGQGSGQAGNVAGLLQYLLQP